MITITLAFGSMKSFFHFSLSFTVAAQSESLFLPYQLSRTAEPQSKKYPGSQHMSAVVREGGPLGAQNPPVVVFKVSTNPRIFFPSRGGA